MFDNYPEGSFQHLFWEEHKKAAANKDLRGIHWHPLMIRFCLYLRHQSGKAYETLIRLRLYQASFSADP